MDTEAFDVVVIGAGAVGENVADRVVQGGLSVALVEAELVGGECSYWACMPSKALLRAGAAGREAADVEGAGAVGALDPAAVLARRDRIVHHWDDSGQVRWADGAGITVVRGHARFDGARRLVVTDADDTGRVVTARSAVAVCTGSAAILPDIPGLREVAPWTSREAASAREVPARLTILGGGVVGCEMATIYADLGARVTLVARNGLLGGTEPFVGETIAAALGRRGVDVRLGVEALGARFDGDQTVLDLSDGTHVAATRVLVAVGRTARTADLGLDTIDVDPGDWLATDDTMRVAGSDWLYAAGDVTGRALLTHQGKYQARAVGDAIVARATGAPLDDGPWGRHAATADVIAVPQVVFTDPEVATVGLTADAAQRAGRDVAILDYDLASLGGATVRADDYRGRARAIIDRRRNVLLGMTLVGAGVGEMIHAATVAIVGEVPLHRLWHAVPAYPTLSEVWLRLLEAAGRDTAERPVGVR